MQKCFCDSTAKSIRFLPEINQGRTCDSDKYLKQYYTTFYNAESADQVGQVIQADSCDSDGYVMDCPNGTLSNINIADIN